MRKDQTVRFSSIASTKMKSLTAMGYGFMNKSPNKHNNSVYSIAQGKPARVNKSFVVDTPKIEGFSQKTKIILTQERVKQINRKLEIDNEAQRNFDRRIKAQDFYFDQKNNPFTKEFKQNGIFKEANTQRSHTIEKRNALTELNRLKFEGNTKQSIKKRVAHLPLQSLDLIGRIKKQVDKKMRHSTHEQQSDFKQILKSVYYTNRAQKTDIEWLNQLVNTKEQSFFKNYYKKQKNIFLLIKDDNHRDFHSSKQILAKLYLDLTSMIPPKSKNRKSHVDCLNQISSSARQIMYIQKQPQTKSDNQLTQALIDMGRLQFQEIMLIATGKLNRYNMDKFFIEVQNRVGGDDDSIGQRLRQKKQITQAKDTKSRGDNCYPTTQNQAEIEYYRKSLKTESQRDQYKLSKAFNIRLKQLLQEQIFLLNNGIIDEATISKLQNLMNNTLIEMLQGNVSNQYLSRLNKNSDRKIRYNKQNKNRSQNIKIVQVVQALKTLSKEKHRQEPKQPKRSRSPRQKFITIKK